MTSHTSLNAKNVDKIDINTRTEALQKAIWEKLDGFGINGSLIHFAIIQNDIVAFTIKGFIRPIREVLVHRDVIDTLEEFLEDDEVLYIHSNRIKDDKQTFVYEIANRRHPPLITNTKQYVSP